MSAAVLAILAWIALAACGWGLAELAEINLPAGLTAALVVGALIGGLAARKMADK